MGLLGKLLGRKDSKDDRAGALVQFAKINATTLFVPLLEQYPALRSVDTEQWDFIMTVAGVFMGLSRLNHAGFSESERRRISNVVSDQLDSWNSDSIRGFEDCGAFFDREFDRLTTAGQEPLFIGADALGLWIIWNVLGRQPKSREEIQLARTVGTMVIAAFFDYWK